MHMADTSSKTHAQRESARWKKQERFVVWLDPVSGWAVAEVPGRAFEGVVFVVEGFQGLR